ncbi:TfoX/Sxy family protein [Moraxella oblonga]|uniref:TfoX/Sxy family protein n=1 Tax=Moraxella oblonga TaxID=200413 RepID=UPI00082EA588|nr:TfoX/Sxy family protein [Moraxella oblonga]
MKALSEFTIFILDQLTPLAPINVRRMFGAECLFKNGKMFAIINHEQMYLKANNDTAHHFIQRDCEPFSYLTTRAGIQKRVLLHYYQLPESALDDVDELCDWVRLGILASQP